MILALFPSSRKRRTCFILNCEIMLVGLGPELDFLQLDLDLFLLGFLQLLALLILEFAVIHDPADRRNGCRRNLDQVQLLAFRQRQVLREAEESQLFTFGTDYPDFFRPDGLIDVDRGFSYDATS